MESINEQEIVARVMAAIKAEQARPAADPDGCEVTVCIPTFDSLCWEFGSLSETLHALRWTAQGMWLKLVLCDNGSRDGTQLLLRAMSEAGDPWDSNQVVRQFWLERFKDIKVAEAVPQNEEYSPGQARINYHQKIMYPRMLELVDTPYVLTVDSDVRPPRRCARIMLDFLKENPDVGLVGIKYPPKSDHVQHGLAMMETEFRRSLPWEEMRIDQLQRCTCVWMNEQVKARGKTVAWLDWLSAGHTKWERG